MNGTRASILRYPPVGDDGVDRQGIACAALVP
jgi:hypothetical protein